MQLSKLEEETYEELRKKDLNVFKIRDICLLLKIKKTKAYNIIKALKKKKAIKPVGKRFFALNNADDFIIATSVNHPSYISFWTALNYYGFSDQNPKKIFIATTKYSKDLNNFKFITISKNRFFGYVQINNLIIAEKEKAIIDSLLFPKYSGGIKEIETSIKKSIDIINQNKLIEYAFRVKNKAVLRRLGFILEKINLNKKIIARLNAKIGKGFELLDPSLEKKNNFNKKWLLDINI